MTFPNADNTLARGVMTKCRQLFTLGTNVPLMGSNPPDIHINGVSSRGATQLRVPLITQGYVQQNYDVTVEAERVCAHS
jgi:hypothetical protein